MSIRDAAAKWWAEMTKRGEYVASADQTPDQRKREFLVSQGFLCRAAKGYWILKRPEDTVEEVFPLLYWQLIDKILSPLEHWSVRDHSALAILSGNESTQKKLLIRTRKKTNRKISLLLGFSLYLAYDPDFDERLTNIIHVGGRSIPVDISEKVLIGLSRLPMGEALNFLRGTDFDLRILDAIYATKPKPIVFAHLSEFARKAGRPDLAVGLEDIIRRHTDYQVVKRLRGDETRIAEEAKPTSPPWVLRQEQRFREFQRVLEKQLARKIGRLKTYRLDELVDLAREQKKYDTYHSTTLEGYRITPEEVDALLSGTVPDEREDDPGKYREEIKNRMAILGYSGAFDFVLNKVQEDFGKPYVGEELVKDIYYHLFKPSADAGITDYLSLTRYRNTPAFIRGAMYVPPSYEKLPELMAGFEVFVNQVENPIVKAVLAHYWFVTIHPYGDGNGRTARLLMDYLLLASGYQWVTIRVDQRAQYFESLKQGQVEGNILPFGEFILDSVKTAGQ